jgi:hypothetical protein
MLWLLYPWGNSPQYPVERRLARPVSLSGCEQKLCAPARNQTLVILTIDTVSGAFVNIIINSSFLDNVTNKFRS